MKENLNKEFDKAGKINLVSFLLKTIFNFSIKISLFLQK